MKPFKQYIDEDAMTTAGAGLKTGSTIEDDDMRVPSGKFDIKTRKDK